MINLNDIFRRSFLAQLETTRLEDIVVAFLMAAIIGIFIFFVYKYTFGGIMYSRNFNVSLITLTIMTNFIILAVASNVVLSLGMVGALSIVRFRTAIKDPMDLVFLFWAIGAGIVIGARFHSLAIIGSILIGAIMFATSRKLTFDTPYLIIVNCEDKSSEDACIAIIKRFYNKCRLKSKIVSSGKGTEFIYEIRGKNDNTEFIDEISKVAGVTNASLVSYNGEFLD